MKVEDPFCTVITEPRGPWGAWARFNIARGGPSAVTVLQQQEANRPILALINKIVCQRVKAKRHVFVEQPSGSSWLSEPETDGIQKLSQSGDLILIKFHGCQLGYQDSENGLPNFKPPNMSPP